MICSPCLNRKNVTAKNLGAIPRVAPTVPTGLDKIEVTRTAAASDYRAVGTRGQSPTSPQILADFLTLFQ